MGKYSFYDISEEEIEPIPQSKLKIVSKPMKQLKIDIELFKEMLYMHKIQYRKDYENIIKKCEENNRNPNDYSIFRRYMKVIKQLEKLEKNEQHV